MGLKVDTIQNPSSATVNLTLDTNGNATVGNNLTVAGTQTTTGTVVMGSSFLRNRLINGNMYVAQRATSATVTAGTTVPTISTGYPCVDRWFVYSVGANVTAAQVAGATNNKNLLQVTGAASVTAVGIGQRIEQLNSYDLAGQTCTLSVNIANSLLTTVTWTASYATTTADTFGTIGTPTKTQIATGTFTVTATLTQYTVNIAVPAAATTGLEILFTVGAQTSGTWQIGNAQFEVGSVATPFERQIYSNQLAQCQRYYYRNTAPSTGTLLTTSGICQSTTSAIGMTQFPVTMRAAPTALEQSGTAAHYQVFVSSNVACNAVPTFLAANVWYATTTATAASGLSANLPFWVTAANTAAYLGWSAEL